MAPFLCLNALLVAVLNAHRRDAESTKLSEITKEKKYYLISVRSVVKDMLKSLPTPHVAASKTMLLNPFLNFQRSYLIAPGKYSMKNNMEKLFT